jgi:membrane-associated protease RseP (regulator of RpoE activity)
MTTDSITEMRRAVEEVMEVTDVTLGDAEMPLRVRGHLMRPSEEAFAILRERFEALDHTPLLRREEGLDVVRALPTVFNRSPGTPWVAIILLAATVLSVFSVGILRGLNPASAQGATFSDYLAAIPVALGYTAALLGILGAHEMGHYLMARRRGVRTTLPFFIPLPFVSLIGTLGAVIAMREPAPNRRVQFDIGVAGPIAGLVVAIPVLIIGLMGSQVTPIDYSTSFLFEGNSLLYLGLKYLIFGRVLPGGGMDVWINDIAWAGWVGLFVTALNLLPVGQLDGGHVMYGLFGEKARWARWPVIGVLLALTGMGMLSEMGILPWGVGSTNWALWVLLLFFLARNNAPVLDEITELDTGRKIIGIGLLILFVLIFVPAPLTPYYPGLTSPLPTV